MPTKVARLVGPVPNFFETNSACAAGISPFFFCFHPIEMDEMDAMDESPDHNLPASVNSTGNDVLGYRPRGYQLEMLEASQQQNIIVAVC